MGLRIWWAEADSNHRRRQPADLQSAPFGHLGICPNLSRRWESNPRPSAYKADAPPIELRRRSTIITQPIAGSRFCLSARAKSSSAPLELCRTGSTVSRLKYTQLHRFVNRSAAGHFTTRAKISTVPTGRGGELIFCGGMASRRKKSIREESFV